MIQLMTQCSDLLQIYASQIGLQLFLAMLIFLIGLFNMIESKNLVKSIVSFGILNTAVIIFFVLLSTQTGFSIPIYGDPLKWGPMVDPLPQALMITAIVIGAATTSLALMMSIKLFHYYGSLEWKDIFGGRK